MPKKIPKGAEVVEIPEKDEEKEKMIYMCILCKHMFKDPGLCPNCNTVLKKGAE